MQYEVEVKKPKQAEAEIPEGAMGERQSVKQGVEGPRAEPRGGAGGSSRDSFSQVMTKKQKSIKKKKDTED